MRLTAHLELLGRVHCIPLNDVDLHAASMECWCHPTEVDPLVVAHNAGDCREARERVGRPDPGAGWVRVLEYVTERKHGPIPTDTDGHGRSAGGDAR